MTNTTENEEDLKASSKSKKAAHKEGTLTRETVDNDGGDNMISNPEHRGERRQQHSAESKNGSTKHDNQPKTPKAPKYTVMDRKKITINTTKIDGKIPTSWKSYLRDILIALIPIFILYKISTHPIVTRLGNTPRQPSREENFQQMMHNMYLKRQQEITEKKKGEDLIDQILSDGGLEATSARVDEDEEGKCSATSDDSCDPINSVDSTTPQPKIQRRYIPKRKFIPSTEKEKEAKRKNKSKRKDQSQYQQRRNELYSRRKSSSPSSPPWSYAIASTIMGTFTTKGTETPVQLKSENDAIPENMAKKNYQVDKKGVRITNRGKKGRWNF